MICHEVLICPLPLSKTPAKIALDLQVTKTAGKIAPNLDIRSDVQAIGSEFDLDWLFELQFG